MSDEAAQPAPAERRVSLDKDAAAGPADAGAWPPPAQGSGDAAATGPRPVPHDPQTVTSLPTSQEPGPADAVPPAWAAPAAQPQPTLHDHAAVTSPAAREPGPAGAVPPAWAAPDAPPAAQSQPHPPQARPANPFAPPSAGPPVAPAPPVGGPGPFAPAPGPYAPPGAPAAQPVEAVPPPPIAPDGPGQVPYGYPAAPAPAYAYPAAPQPQPGYGMPGVPPYPAAPGYGWPGMPPQPNNGMGTASLVLGILATVGFCAWPLALVMGIVAIVLGALGRGKARRGEATNPGVALAGIICGSASLVLILVLAAVVIASYGT